MPISSAVDVSFIKILPIVLLPMEVDIVGALVTLELPNKVVFVEKGPKLERPGNRIVIESMSLGWLVLENKGVRENNWFVGLLAV